MNAAKWLPKCAFKTALIAWHSWRQSVARKLPTSHQQKADQTKLTKSATRTQSRQPSGCSIRPAWAPAHPVHPRSCGSTPAFYTRFPAYHAKKLGQPRILSEACQCDPSPPKIDTTCSTSCKKQTHETFPFRKAGIGPQCFAWEAALFAICAIVCPG